MIGLNKIYNEDCLEGMKRIPDKSVDMILCDLPYGTTQNKWDSVIPLDRLWEQYNRIIKDNGAIVLTAQTPFDKALGVSNLGMLKYEWIWEKPNASGQLNAKKMPLKAHENILVFYKKLPTYNPQFEWKEPYTIQRTGYKGSENYGKQADHTTVSDGRRYPRSVNTFGRDKEKLHPTQKPVALFEYLIKTYTDEGETVLDNCAGSFTTAVACDNTNRNWICIEKEEKYCDIGLTRINDNRERLNLPLLNSINSRGDLIGEDD